MARQRRRWEDWMIIAEALDFGRTEIMRDLHTIDPRPPLRKGDGRMAGRERLQGNR